MNATSAAILLPVLSYPHISLRPCDSGMASLSLVLCDDRHIRALNYQHRNKDAPTDVLSFEMDDDLDYVVGALEAF